MSPSGEFLFVDSTPGAGDQSSTSSTGGKRASNTAARAFVMRKARADQNWSTKSTKLVDRRKAVFHQTGSASQSNHRDHGVVEQQQPLPGPLPSADPGARHDAPPQIEQPCDDHQGPKRQGAQPHIICDPHHPTAVAVGGVVGGGGGVAAVPGPTAAAQSAGPRTPDSAVPSAVPLLEALPRLASAYVCVSGASSQQQQQQQRAAARYASDGPASASASAAGPASASAPAAAASTTSFENSTPQPTDSAGSYLFSSSASSGRALSSVVEAAAQGRADLSAALLDELGPSLQLFGATPAAQELGQGFHRGPGGGAFAAAGAAPASFDAISGGFVPSSGVPLLLGPGGVGGGGGVDGDGSTADTTSSYCFSTSPASTPTAGRRRASSPTSSLPSWPSSSASTHPRRSGKAQISQRAAEGQQRQPNRTQPRLGASAGGGREGGGGRGSGSSAGVMQHNAGVQEQSQQRRRGGHNRKSFHSSSTRSSASSATGSSSTTAGRRRCSLCGSLTGARRRLGSVGVCDECNAPPAASSSSAGAASAAEAAGVGRTGGALTGPRTPALDGKVDPFASTAVALDGRTSDLLSYFISAISPQITLVAGSAQSVKIQQFWLAPSLFHSGFMHAMLCLTALHLALMSGRGSSSATSPGASRRPLSTATARYLTLVAEHRIRAIESIRDNLGAGDQARALSDDNIAAVFNLLCVEENLFRPEFFDSDAADRPELRQLRPDHSQRVAHLNGIRRMIRLRGGVAGLGSARALQSFLIRHTAMQAVSSFHPSFLLPRGLMQELYNYPFSSIHYGLPSSMATTCAAAGIHPELVTLASTAECLMRDTHRWFNGSGPDTSSTPPSRHVFVEELAGPNGRLYGWDALDMQNHYCMLMESCVGWHLHHADDASPVELVLATCLAFAVAYCCRGKQAVHGPFPRGSARLVPYFRGMADALDSLRPPGGGNVDVDDCTFAGVYPGAYPQRAPFAPTTTTEQQRRQADAAASADVFGRLRAMGLDVWAATLALMAADGQPTEQLFFRAYLAVLASHGGGGGVGPGDDSLTTFEAVKAALRRGAWLGEPLDLYALHIWLSTPDAWKDTERDAVAAGMPGAGAVQRVRDANKETTLRAVIALNPYSNACIQALVNNRGVNLLVGED